MSGQMMIYIGLGMVGISILFEIILGIIFKATKKRTIKKIYGETE